MSDAFWIGLFTFINGLITAYVAIKTHKMAAVLPVVKEKIEKVADVILPKE